MSARLEEVSRIVTQKLTTSAGVGDPGQIQSRRKATTALFPYAVLQERDGNRGMIDAFIGAASASNSDLWGAVGPFVPTLFSEANPHAIVHVLPHFPWYGVPHDESVVAR